MSNRCATESVAVMTTRRGPERCSRNGKLAAVVLTTTICPGSGFRSAAHSVDERSGPTRLNFASVPSNEPWPISSTNSRSSRPHPRADRVERSPHARRGRRMVRVAAVEQREDLRVVEAELLEERRHRRLAPLPVLLRVGRFAVRARDDQRKALGRRHRRRDQQRHQHRAATDRTSAKGGTQVTRTLRTVLCSFRL